MTTDFFKPKYETTYTYGDFGPIWDRETRTQVERCEVTAVHGPADWHAGWVYRHNKDRYTVECHKGVAECQTMEEAKSIFQEHGNEYAESLAD